MLVGLKRDSFFAWAIAPAVFTVVVLWYQFGFSLGGMLEEWDVLYLIQLHPYFWSSFPGQLLSSLFAARPLQILPHFIANQISSDSFLGFHIVLMAGCALRVIGAAWLGNHLFRNKAYAATFGILCFVFPADTQQFEFRTIHIVFAVGLMVFASACAVHAFTAETQTRSRRRIALLVSVLLSCIATLIYEPFITLYALTPLVLWARGGLGEFVGIIRRRKTILIGWLLGPIFNAAYLFYAIVVFQSSYQVNAANGSMSKSIVQNFHYLIDSDAYRIFYDAWVSAWWMLTQQLVHYRFIVLLAIALLAGLLILSSGSQGDGSLRRTLRYVAAGLILSVVGYLPFMVAESHMVINQRTFMAVAPGGSLIAVAIIAWLFRRFSTAGVVVAAAVVFLGFIAQLYQFDRYTRDYTGVVLPYTSMLADQTDPTKRVHLVFDKTGFGGHLNGMYATKVQAAASVRRREDDGASILCMDQPQTSLMPFSNCALQDGKWVIHGPDGTLVTYPEADVQVITIGPDFDPSYRSRRASWHDHGSYAASKSIFANADPHAYRCEADSMWGYSGFCRGQGWSDGIFNHDHFQHVNYFVSIAPTASLVFPLSPLAKRYVLRAVIFGGVNKGVMSKMKTEINGTDVPFRILDDQILEAEVPQSLLKEGQNQIVFRNATQTVGGTGIALSQVVLAPMRSSLLPVTDAEKHVPPVALNEWHDFSKSGVRPMLRYGFSATESKGTWTDGKSAQMTFMLPSGVNAGTFVGEAIPFFNQSHTRLHVAIDVNGQHVMDKIFNAPAQPESFDVPINLASGDATRPVVLTFTFDDTAQPGNGDQRDLALYFTRFKLTR
jgi:hypothetical protein